MARYLWFVPPLHQWIPGIILLLVFFATTRFSARRRWGDDALLGCVGSVTIFAITLVVFGLVQPLVESPRPLADFVTWGIAGFVFLAPVAFVFSKVERFGTRRAILAASAIGMLTYPVAYLVFLLMACALAEGGCGL